MDDRGNVPVLDWLTRLDARDPRAADKCAARLERLAALGHELRRPEADYLQDELFELRVRHGTVNYRMIYFFHGKHTAVLVEGVIKKDRAPQRRWRARCGASWCSSAIRTLTRTHGDSWPREHATPSRSSIGYSSPATRTVEHESTTMS
ncbi:MAG: type II toxin-antitoxin system RelE/ParE family toxin [Planctomycetota bacterium]